MEKTGDKFALQVVVEGSNAGGFLFGMSCIMWVLFAFFAYCCSVFGIGLITDSPAWKLATTMPLWYWIIAALVFAAMSFIWISETGDPYGNGSHYRLRGVLNWLFCGGLVLALLAGAFWPIAAVWAIVSCIWGGKRNKKYPAYD
jgi:hypothetical protein